MTIMFNIIYRYKDIINIIYHHLFPICIIHILFIIFISILYIIVNIIACYTYTNDIYTHRSFYRYRRCDGFTVISLDTYSWRTTAAAAARSTTRQKCMVINDIYPIYLLCSTCILYTLLYYITLYCYTALHYCTI